MSGFGQLLINKITAIFNKKSDDPIVVTDPLENEILDLILDEFKNLPIEQYDTITCMGSSLFFHPFHKKYDIHYFQGYGSRSFEIYGGVNITYRSKFPRQVEEIIDLMRKHYQSHEKYKEEKLKNDLIRFLKNRPAK